MNIFERASRKSLQFATVRGFISADQLWNMPLQAKSGFSLDDVARQANADLKATTEESFVSPTSSPEKADHELRLEIVKYVIADRLAANEAAKKKAENAAKRARLIDALGRKQEQAIDELTPEELQAQIAALE